MKTDASPWVVRGLYTLAAILVVFPLIDLFTATWPFRFGDLPWRYAAFGVAANYIYLSIVGIALAMGLGYWRHNPRVLGLAGWFCVVVAVLLVPVMGMFALDVVAMTDLRTEEFTRDTLLVGAIQQVKYGMTLIAMGLLGIGARDLRRDRGPRVDAPAPAPGSPGAIRGSAG